MGSDCPLKDYVCTGLPLFIPIICLICLFSPALSLWQRGEMVSYSTGGASIIHHCNQCFFIRVIEELAVPILSKPLTNLSFTQSIVPQAFAAFFIDFAENLVTEMSQP